MKGIKKNQRARVEFLDELRYLAGPNANREEMFEHYDDVGQLLNGLFHNVPSVMRLTVGILILTKAGIPQEKWNRKS